MLLGVHRTGLGALLLDPDVERVEAHPGAGHLPLGHREEAGNVSVAVTVRISIIFTVIPSG